LEYKLLGGGILVHQKSLNELGEAEAVIFDCDGTIIDSTKSYYLTDKVAACIILEKLYGLRIYLGRDLDDVLFRLDMLGGFNNDWHKTSLVIQALLLHSETSGKKVGVNLGPVDHVEEYIERCSVKESFPEDVKAGVAWLIKKISENYGRFMSLGDFEKLVDTEAEKIGKAEQIKDARKTLGPLTSYGSGLLTTLYDELFLGEEGIRRRYGVDPRYVSWGGMLDREELLISQETLRKLEEIVPKGLAIATGRGRWETEKSLKTLIKYFNLEASIFAADLPGEFEKPDARMLIECSKRLNARRVIYVGNSLEDLLLVKNAVKHGVKALFIGVLTNPYAFDHFIRDQADAIIDEVNLLPKVLERKNSFWKPI